MILPVHVAFLFTREVKSDHLSNTHNVEQELDGTPKRGSKAFGVSLLRLKDLDKNFKCLRYSKTAIINKSQSDA